MPKLTLEFHYLERILGFHSLERTRRFHSLEWTEISLTGTDSEISFTGTDSQISLPGMDSGISVTGTDSRISLSGADSGVEVLMVRSVDGLDAGLGLPSVQTFTGWDWMILGKVWYKETDIIHHSAHGQWTQCAQTKHDINKQSMRALTICMSTQNITTWKHASDINMNPMLHKKQHTQKERPEQTRNRTLTRWYQRTTDDKHMEHECLNPDTEPKLN